MTDQTSTTNIKIDGIDRLIEMATSLFEAQRATQKKDQTWSSLKRAFFAFIFISMLVFYVFFYATMFGVNAGPTTDSVALIPIYGEISTDSEASSANIAPLIKQACEASHVKLIALDISSPGGSPNEAERIVQAMETCRLEHKKKIYAVIGDMGASAAYMIAMHSDRIVAGKYSVVGSIGAVMRYVDASAAATKYGLNERVFRSGPLKGGPSMLSGSNVAMDQVNQEMVEKLGHEFLMELYSARKGKVTAKPEDLFTGRIWTANETLQLGLIDQISTIEGLSATQWKGLKLHRYAIKQSFVKGFGFHALMKEQLQKITNSGAPVLE